MSIDKMTERNIKSGLLLIKRVRGEGVYGFNIAAKQGDLFIRRLRDCVNAIY